MANLGVVPVIAANPNSTHTVRSITYVSSIYFGASQLSAGLGAVSSSQVTNQSVVALPTQVTPVQYWS